MITHSCREKLAEADNEKRRCEMEGHLKNTRMFWKIRQIDEAIHTWESSGRRRRTATNKKWEFFKAKH